MIYGYDGNEVISVPKNSENIDVDYYRFRNVNICNETELFDKYLCTYSHKLAMASIAYEEGNTGNITRMPHFEHSVERPQSFPD